MNLLKRLNTTLAEDYIAVFLEEGPAVFANAPFWFRLMFQSILNTPGYTALFEYAIRSAPSSLRKFYRHRISELANDNPNYREILGRIGPI